MREFFDKPAGKAVAVVLGLVALGFSAWMLYGSFGPTELMKLSRERVFIDEATGKPFEYTLQTGDKAPVKAPSGGQTGYPAELCYWTKAGASKPDPTPVMLKIWHNKGEPTFCPDCGRLVTVHNPAPGTGVKAPPTREEYQKILANPANAE